MANIYLSLGDVEMSRASTNSGSRSLHLAISSLLSMISHDIILMKLKSWKWLSLNLMRFYMFLPPKQQGFSRDQVAMLRSLKARNIRLQLLETHRRMRRKRSKTNTRNITDLVVHCRANNNSTNQPTNQPTNPTPTTRICVSQVISIHLALLPTILDTFGSFAPCRCFSSWVVLQCPVARWNTCHALARARDRGPALATSCSVFCFLLMKKLPCFLWNSGV